MQGRGVDWAVAAKYFADGSAVQEIGHNDLRWPDDVQAHAQVGRSSCWCPGYWPELRSLIGSWLSPVWRSLADAKAWLVACCLLLVACCLLLVDAGLAWGCRLAQGTLATSVPTTLPQPAPKCKRRISQNVSCRERQAPFRANREIIGTCNDVGTCRHIDRHMQ